MNTSSTEPVVAAQAFLSYARRDDERENGRILRLATLLKEEFESLTGSTIEIFTDRRRIEWGDDFRQKLNEALESTTFFIPVLTPTYFMREECRREMSTFVTSATALGLTELLMSIRYLPVADMTEDSRDSLKALAAKMSYEPWQELRLEDENSPEHRRAVNRLAQRLVDLTSRLEGAGSRAADRNPGGSLASSDAALQRPPGSTGMSAADRSPEPDSTPPARSDEDEEDDDAPGLLDLIADVVPAMHDWTATMSGISSATNSFGDKFASATKNLPAVNSAPDGFSKRLMAFRALAAEVEPELKQLETLSKDYALGVLRIDAGLSAVAALARDQDVDTGPTRTAISGLVASSREAMKSLAYAADTARDNSKHSRDLRPVLRRFETVARNIIDASNTMEGWEEQFPLPA